MLGVEISSDEFTRLAGLADDAADQHEWEHQISRAILASDAGELARMVAMSFDYHAAHRSREGDPDHRFGPMLEFVDGTAVPSALERQSDEVCMVWNEVAVRASSPIVLARLHDLLFERRWPDVGHHGRSAAEAYLTVGSAVPPEMQQVDALCRAHQIARVIKDDDLRERAGTAMLRAAQADLAQEALKPGVTLRLLEALVDDHHPDAEVDELLGHARVRYRSAWHTEHTIELQRKRASTDSDRKELDRQLVQAWLDEANNADPLVAVLHRQKAAQMARSRGVSDLAEAAVRALQSADPVGLPVISAEVESSVTREEVEGYVESLVGTDSWWHAVMRILAAGPPTGDVVRNRELATDLAKDFPLQNLFPKVRLGSDGLPRYESTTDEQRLDDQLADVEAIALQTSGGIFAEAFRRAGSRHELPGPDALPDVLANAGVADESTSKAIGRALGRFYAGDAEGAAYTALPIIERISRKLLLAVDAPLYHVQREGAPGQYPGLGALLAALYDHGFDPSWYRFLRTYLTAPNGMNLRNEALHGFLDDISEPGAALVLIALLYTAVIQPRAAQEHHPAA